MNSPFRRLFQKRSRIPAWVGVAAPIGIAAVWTTLILLERRAARIEHKVDALNSLAENTLQRFPDELGPTPDADQKLDRGLADSFPASDPVAISEPSAGH